LLFSDNVEFLQESVIKAIGKEGFIVEWVDCNGSKFGKLLTTDRIFKMQQKQSRNVVKVYSFVFVFVCVVIFSIGVSQQFENLKAVR